MNDDEQDGQRDERERQEVERLKRLKQLQELDQALATFADNMPSLWWRMYQNLQAAGFTPEQAWDLLKTYAHGSAGGNYKT